MEDKEKLFKEKNMILMTQEEHRQTMCVRWMNNGGCCCPMCYKKLKVIMDKLEKELKEAKINR